LTATWYDEEERLTPDALETTEFPVSRLGRRGYDEESVNRFLHMVHTEWVRLVNERASLWQEVQRLRQRIVTGETNGHGQAVLFGQADAHVHAVRILSTAQQTADRYVADAQAYSSRVTTEARQRRDHVIREAQQHSDLILQDAQARAREAAVTALNAPAPLETDQERQAAQAELAYLRTYSDVYRAHLRAYTEGVLRSIEEWERKAASVQVAENGDADHHHLSNGH
jgi:DivIVA domain-containing protein